MSTFAIFVFLGLAVLGMPLAFALGIASLAALNFGDLGLASMPQRMMYAVNSFPLMAIPLFMLAGEIIVKAGIMDRLIDLANSMVGRVHGGLAHVTILAGMVLASVSGAAVASASALGASLIPALRKHYEDGYSSAVIASAANLGPIIPPSSAMIVYALMAGSTVSVGGLFMAGVIPGILLTIGFMVIASWISIRRGYAYTGDHFSFRNVFYQIKRSAIVFMMPVIVVGGIVGGLFTATEGSAIAVAYATFIGFVVTRRLRVHDLPGCLFRAAVTSAMVAALIAFASTLTFVFTIDLVPQRLASVIREFASSPTTFILVVMGLLVLVGMFIESNAAYIMLVPLLSPIASSYGIDPLYFGLLFVLNLVVGMMTPPVGVLLFVMSGITRVSITTIAKEVIPFVALQFMVLLAVFFFPSLVTFLPKYLGF